MPMDGELQCNGITNAVTHNIGITNADGRGGHAGHAPTLSIVNCHLSTTTLLAVVRAVTLVSYMPSHWMAGKTNEPL